MEITLSNKTVNCKKSIITLTVVSLVFQVISFIPMFYHEVSIRNENGTKYAYDDTYTYKMVFDIPDMYDTLTLILCLAPYILFLIFVLKLHNKPKGAVVMPIVFGLFILCRYSSAYGPLFLFSWRVHEFVCFYLIALTLLVSLIALNGFLKKKIYVFVMVAIMAIDLIDVVLLVDYSYNAFSSHLSVLLIDMALLLFGLKNTVASVIKSELKIKSQMKLSPEQMLKTLKNSYESGIITEEEYNEKRKEIILKL